MPQTFQIDGEYLELEDRDIRAILTRLASHTRNKVFLRPKMRFEYAQSRWQWYANSNGAMRWVIEAAGDAHLPPQSRMRRLAGEKRRLESCLTPRKIDKFYEGFARWNTDATRFYNAMVAYVDRFESGGIRTIRALELTRDGSFQALLMLSSLGAGAAAAAAVRAGTISAGRALAGNAAVNIGLRCVNSEVQNLQRRLAGNPPTRVEQERQIINNTIDGLSDVAFGDLVGRFMRPITGNLHDMAEAAMARGRFGSGVVYEQIASRIDGILANAVERMTSSARREFQLIMQEALLERNEAAAARRAAQRLIENRRFQALVDQGLGV